MGVKMKAIVLENINEFVKKEISYPESKPGYAIIKINALGICGSDIHAFSGNQPMFSFPKIIGHEIAAEIVESKKFEQGKAITLMPYISCGKCIACINGKENACENLSVLGVHSDGGMTEYMSVPEDIILPVDGLSANQIAMIEPLAISEHAFSRAKAKEDEIVVVSGVGPIGMGIIVMAKYRKAKVIAVDFNEDRLKFARDVLKADYVIKPDDTLVDQVKKITNDSMATKVYDATGNKYAMNNAVNLLSHGGSMVFVGLHKENIEITDLLFHKREATLYASRAAYKKDFETVIEMIQSSFFDPNHLVTASLTMDNFIEKFDETIKDSNAIKTVVTF